MADGLKARLVKPHVHGTILGDFKPTPEDHAALAKLQEKWPERFVSGLTPEQRKIFRELLLKKREPKKSRGGQPKWDEARLTRLLALERDARSRGFSYEQSLDLLALIFNFHGEGRRKKIQARLAKARNLSKS